MEADSKDVAKALKTDVFPILRAAGFARFKSRTAWRDDAETISVVDFRSLGSYLGSRVGVTSHSFGAVAGIYFKAVHATPWSTEPLPEMPEALRLGQRDRARAAWRRMLDNPYYKGPSPMRTMAEERLSLI